jgi:hypothetical protein
MQKLDADNLIWEGEEMGHCVGGYCNAVMRGSSIIYSLRDDKGYPHATIELEPANQFDEDNRRYNLIQVQGKGNKEPNPEYKDMIGI